MKIETHIQEDHQAKLQVEVETEQLDAMKRRAAKKIARRIKIPGFRPGKAPYPVILRQVGEGTIIEEAMELLVNDIYPKVIAEADIKPYGPGSLQEVTSMDPPTMEFIIPLEAEVVLGDYRSLREPYEPEEVSDSEVEDVLNNLQERQALIEPVERAAEENDLVTVKLSAKRTDAEDEDDDEEYLIEERSTPFIISVESENTEDEEDETQPEWPYPGFSESLIGLSAEDEKSFTYTYPEDSEVEAYRGIEAEFRLIVESVKSRTLPDLDDEFAKSLGDYDDLEALKAEIRTTLEAQKEQAYNANYDETIIEKTLEDTTIKYPPQMLDQELNNVVGNLEERLNQQGLDMDLYLKTRSLDMDGLREEMIPIAESRLKQTLVLLEIAKKEDLQLDPNQVQNETQSTLDFYKQTLPKKDARKLSDQKVYSNLMSNIMADMLISQSMDRLRDIFRGLFDEVYMQEEQDEAAQAAVDNIAEESREVVDAAIADAEAIVEPAVADDAIAGLETASDTVENETAADETEEESPSPIDSEDDDTSNTDVKE